ncbi:MAG: ABC transporter ATP-binding protein [Candidatus Nomurabacteria bacterium]|jgi:putative ABC transport system ATP-binding protein|nr:ABC transporter ATP-binding protein [Candidatus Nomurabacteria bacterium]
MSVIRASHLTKIYGKKSAEFTALDDVSLSVEPGESVAIVGKSGSGKSTLMHCLALLDKPTRGSVSVDDEIIYGGKPAAAASKKSGKKSEKKFKRPRAKDINRLRNRRFGFVFQSFFMNANDSVLRNVELPLKIAGVRPRARKKRALLALKQVELFDKAKNRAKDLSGGQKQRVCIARALVNSPSVIFADEPTGNLDSATGQLVENILFKLNQKAHITLIIVTHDPDLAARCGRQIHISDGKIVEAAQTEKSAKPAEVKTSAKSSAAENSAKPLARISKKSATKSERTAR